MITLTSLPNYLLLLFSLAPSALSKLSPFFIITSYLNRHSGATSASLRIEDRASTQPLCLQDSHMVMLMLMLFAYADADADAVAGLLKVSLKHPGKM